MASVCLSACRKEGVPDLSGCGNEKRQGLNKHGDSTKESTIDEFFLMFPKCVLGIHGDYALNSNFGRRSDHQSINETSEFIAIEESMHKLDGST